MKAVNRRTKEKDSRLDYSAGEWTTGDSHYQGPSLEDALLVASRVSVRYPRCRHCSLEDASLAIGPGERVALVGPSGGGKTTLLRVLEGSLAPSEGQILRHGRAALIYQDLRLVVERTVLANVCSGAFGSMAAHEGFWGFPGSVRERATELLEELGLGQLARRRVGSLSGGQRQRVAIARALMARPSILLADEPLAALDRRNARRTLDLLQSLQSRHGFALVLSIHDPDIAAGFFTRFVAVDDGQVSELPREMFGSSREWRQYEFAASRPVSSVQGDDDGTFESPKEDSHMGWLPLRNTTAVAQDDPSAEPLEQDRALSAEPSILVRTLWRVGAVLALTVALAWSARSLQISDAAFHGAFQGLMGFLGGVMPKSWAEFVGLPWATLAASLVQTIQMAILGTFLGVMFSLPLAVLASRQTGPRLVQGATRFLLNGIRTVPSIFWALLFVAFVGLGPVAGVFALAAYSCGYLTKFFYEALEDADNKPASALRALGASRLQTFWWASLPAARPALLGACLFMFEYNIRASSILGVVGAGGIGQDLMYYIEWRQFPAAAAGLLMLLVIVVALDSVSQAYRRKLTRQRGV
jgi:phosphonate transport system permease protein